MSASLVCRLAKVQPVPRMKRRIRREPGQLQESSGEGPHNLPGPASPIRHVFLVGLAGAVDNSLPGNVIVATCVGGMLGIGLAGLHEGE